MPSYNVRPLDEIIAAVVESAPRVHDTVIQRPDSNFSQLVREFAAHLRNGGGSDAQTRNNIATYLDLNPEALADLQRVIGDRQVGFQGAGEHALALSVLDSQGNTEIIRITRAQEPAVPEHGDVLRPSASASLGDIRITHSSPAVSLEEFVQEGVINRGEADRLNNQHRADMHRDGLHNSDPHLDNTGVTPDGRIVVTDSGAVRTLAEERARVATLPEGSQKDAARQELDILEKASAGPRVNPQPSVLGPPEPARLDGRSQLGNTRLGGEATPPIPSSGGSPDVLPHVGGGGHAPSSGPHTPAPHAAGSKLPPGLKTGAIGVAVSMVAGAVSAAPTGSVAEMGKAALASAVPGAGASIAFAEGNVAEASIQARVDTMGVTGAMAGGAIGAAAGATLGSAVPVAGNVAGALGGGTVGSAIGGMAAATVTDEYLRLTERYWNGNNAVAPSAGERLVTAAGAAVQAGASAVVTAANEGVKQAANWWNGTSVPSPQPQQEHAMPSLAEKAVQPEQEGMAAILAQARQATASMATKVEVHSESNMPLPSSQVVHNAKAPETSAGVGHA